MPPVARVLVRLRVPPVATAGLPAVTTAPPVATLPPPANGGLPPRSLVESAPARPPLFLGAVDVGAVPPLYGVSGVDWGLPAPATRLLSVILDAPACATMLPVESPAAAASPTSVGIAAPPIEYAARDAAALPPTEAPPVPEVALPSEEPLAHPNKETPEITARWNVLTAPETKAVLIMPPRPAVIGVASSAIGAGNFTARHFLRRRLSRT
jgi:hypothetical protein